MTIFSEQQWAKIAQSIPIEELSCNLRKEISDALFAYELGIIAGGSEGGAEAETDNRSERRSRYKKISKVSPDARKRQALELLRETLKRLEKFARDTRLTLSGIQVDLRPESLINKVEALLEELYGVQKAAELELATQPRPRGGRPLEISRDALIFRLVDVYARHIGRPGLSRSRDPKNPDRLKPSGPCYRFVFTILELRNISTKGIEHVIAKAARHVKNHP